MKTDCDALELKEVYILLIIVYTLLIKSCYIIADKWIGIQ